MFDFCSFSGSKNFSSFSWYRFAAMGKRAGQCVNVGVLPVNFSASTGIFGVIGCGSLVNCTTREGFEVFAMVYN